MIFPYNFLYAQSCRIHHVFWAWELVLYRIQNGGLTTQHDTEKPRESFLIWSIFDRNFTFKWVIVSIFNLNLCFFLDSSRSESIRVDPSWPDPDWRSELIRSDFCTCLIISDSAYFHPIGGYIVLCLSIFKNFLQHAQFWILGNIQSQDVFKSNACEGKYAKDHIDITITKSESKSTITWTELGQQTTQAKMFLFLRKAVRFYKEGEFGSRVLY